MFCVGLVVVRRWQPFVPRLRAARAAEGCWAAITSEPPGPEGIGRLASGPGHDTLCTDGVDLIAAVACGVRPVLRFPAPDTAATIDVD